MRKRRAPVKRGNNGASSGADIAVSCREAVGLEPRKRPPGTVLRRTLPDFRRHRPELEPAPRPRFVQSPRMQESSPDAHAALPVGWSRPRSRWPWAAAPKRRPDGAWISITLAIAAAAGCRLPARRLAVAPGPQHGSGGAATRAAQSGSCGASWRPTGPGKPTPRTACWPGAARVSCRAQAPTGLFDAGTAPPELVAMLQARQPFAGLRLHAAAARRRQRRLGTSRRAAPRRPGRLRRLCRPRPAHRPRRQPARRRCGPGPGARGPRRTGAGAVTLDGPVLAIAARQRRRAGAVARLGAATRRRMGHPALARAVGLQRPGRRRLGRRRGLAVCALAGPPADSRHLLLVRQATLPAGRRHAPSPAKATSSASRSRTTCAHRSGWWKASRASSRKTTAGCSTVSATTTSTACWVRRRA